MLNIKNTDIKNNELLYKIISDIRTENSKDWRIEEGITISQDNSNECIVNILKSHIENYSELTEKYNVLNLDDSDNLTDIFGYDGYCAVREAEQGEYDYYFDLNK